MNFKPIFLDGLPGSQKALLDSQWWCCTNSFALYILYMWKFLRGDEFHVFCYLCIYLKNFPHKELTSWHKYISISIWITKIATTCNIFTILVTQSGNFPPAKLTTFKVLFYSLVLKWISHYLNFYITHLMGHEILWMALFLWVPVLVYSTKITRSWGSKFVAMIFSFLPCFVGTGSRGSDPPRKPRKLVPHKKLSHPQYIVPVLCS